MIGALLASLFLPFTLAVSTIYWPVTNPTASSPWVIGKPNYVSWNTGGGVGIVSFDIQLHNSNKDIMVGSIPIALRVPMERLPTGRKNYGGELEVDLTSGIPTGDGFSLIFQNTYHGQVYAKSPTFSIYAQEPSNYTNPSDIFTATVTATLTDTPNPTQEWALTMNGINPDATAVPTMLAGQAGSGH